MRFFKDILSHIAATLALAAIGAAMPACSGADEPEAVGVQGVAKVGFTITVGDSAGADGSRGASRATPAGDYDAGSGYENYIDLDQSDFRFYFFSTDNKYIGEISIISVVPVQSAAGWKRYVVMGSIPASIGDISNFKVCVLANWSSYPDLTAGDPLSNVWTDANAIYSFRDGTVDADALIPLYGIKEYSGVKFNVDEQISLDNIHLLRAFSKVEVTLDESVYPIESLVLTRVNSTGRKAPEGIDSEDKYVHNNYESDYVNTPHIPAGVSVLENVPLIPVADAPEGMRRYMIYVPEYDNTSAAAIPARLHLNYTDPAIITDDIEFKYYTATGTHAAGERFDLLRNYWYRFTVSQGPADLNVQVDVQPYAQVVLDPDLGLERDEEGYIIVRNNKGDVIKYIRPDGENLTLGPIYMPFYGTIRAVFDSKRRALIGYLPDGRMVYWNYDGEEQSSTNMTSWEIYTDNSNRKVDVHLDEDYILRPSDNSRIEAFTHSVYDDKGRVITRYLYPSNEAFEARTADGAGATELVSYTGSKYGAKVITYKDKSGKKYCEITVTVNDDGTETETYAYYN